LSADTSNGHFDGAIADYTKAIEINPKCASTYRNRGYARENKGDLVGAIMDFEQFLKLAPNNSLAPELRKFIAELKKNLRK